MKKVIAFIMAFPILVGCILTMGRLPPTPTQTPTVILPTITTPTPLPPTVTITPTNTPEVLTLTCPETKTEIPIGDVEGVIVLNGAYSFNDPSVGHYVTNPGSAYLWDINADTKTELPHAKSEELLGFSVSPNHKLLGYQGRIDQGSNRIMVVDVNGKTIRNVVDAYNWFALQGWLDNEHLAVWMLSDITDGRPFPTLIYNPFDRDRKLIMPDYPKISPWYQPGWDETMTVYNSGANFVVYPTSGHVNQQEGIILWDVNKKQQIGFIPTNNITEVGLPVWSDDKQQFVVDINQNQILNFNDPAYHVAEELFSLGKDGNIKRLTYLTNSYQDLQILSKSWAPDGNSIAFIYRPQRYDDHPVVYKFAVLDVGTGNVREYCIENIADSEPIWSPNSKQILLLTYPKNNPNEKIEPHVLLLDIQKNYIVEIAKDLLPAGWLVSEP